MAAASFGAFSAPGAMASLSSPTGLSPNSSSILKRSSIENDLVIFDGKKRKGHQGMRYFSQPELKNVEITFVVALSSSRLFAWTMFSERAL